VDDPLEHDQVLAAIDDPDWDGILNGYISRLGRIVAWESRAGEPFILDGEIRTTHDGTWEPAGEQQLYRLGTASFNEITVDARRLFLAQSLRLGAESRFAGWKSRIVALIPEEDGAHESKIMRTLADGSIEATHTYNPLDAYATYAQQVTELAMEFGANDELMDLKSTRPGNEEDDAEVSTIVQAWLMREAAQAELEQARHSLRFGLAGHARLLKRSSETRESLARVAEALYTDRTSLSKIVRTAESDPRIAGALDALESDGGKVPVDLPHR
jgi:hypothetical protein